MTVASSVSRITVAGNSSATSFSFPFKITSSAHLVVTKTTAAGITSTLTLGTHYSVTGVGSESGGSITYPLSGTALPTGDTLTMRRVVPLTQTVDLTNQGAFYAEVHESEFDHLTYIAQQLSDDLTVLDSIVDGLIGDVPGALSAYSFAGDGSQVLFTLGQTLNGVRSVLIAVDGVLQGIETYAVSGTSLVFSEAPPYGSLIDVRVIGSATDVSLVDGSLVTATGSTTPRTLEARFGEIINVKNFTAKGDLKQRTAALTIASGTPTTMVLAGADFSSTDIGKVILIPGVGAAGVQLITTISAVTSTTTITIGTAATTFVSAVSTRVEWGTDDSAAIQAAVTALRAQTALTLANGTNGTLYFPTGIYLVRTTIDITSIVGARIVAQSALLYGATAGKPIVDAMATYGLTVEGLALYGDRWSGPNVGWQLGRNHNGAGAFGRNCYRSIVMYGYFSLCCFYKMASETSTFDFLNLTNSATNAYALIDDGCHHFGLTSDFVTITQPANDPFTNTVVTFNQCKMVAQGSGSNAMWVAAAASHTWNNCYWNSLGSGIVIYTDAVIRSNDLHFSGTIEGPAAHNFYFDGTNASALSGFSFTTCANTSTTSTFGNAVGLTTMKLYDVNVHLASVATGVKVFNDPTIWQVSGHFGAAAITDGWIAPSVFFGTLSINATSSTSYQSLVRTGPDADASRFRIILTGTHTIPNTTGWYSGVQTGTIATATLTFPTPVNNGQILRITTRGTITALTLTPQGGATINGWTNGTVLPANSSLIFGWDSTSSAWDRLGGDGAGLDRTITAAGTTGARTINKPMGAVNFAAAASTLVVTNSLVTANSIVLADVATADATAYIKSVVPTAGSFTITLGAAATAETRVNWLVLA